VEKAIELFNEMKDRKIQPNQRAYNAILSTLANATPVVEWEKALHYLKEMKESTNN
jgi:hypothetical protein